MKDLTLKEIRKIFLANEKKNRKIRKLTEEEICNIVEKSVRNYISCNAIPMNLIPSVNAVTECEIRSEDLIKVLHKCYRVINKIVDEIASYMT